MFQDIFDGKPLEPWSKARSEGQRIPFQPLTAILNNSSQTRVLKKRAEVGIPSGGPKPKK